MQEEMAAETSGKRTSWFWLVLWLPVLAIVIGAVAAAPWLVGPECPKEVVIAAGVKDGPYDAFAQRLRRTLARDGITLTVRTTSGSGENTDLLLHGEENVSLALVDGSDVSTGNGSPFETLASLPLEPIWVFTRSERPVQQLAQLKGKRIAVGVADKGLQHVLVDFLIAGGLNPESEGRRKTTVFPDGERQASGALKRGDIDAAVFVASPRSRLVQELLRSEGIHLMDFGRRAGAGDESSNLASTTIAKGSLSRRSNLPARDLVLLTPTANLVARQDLHPALVPALLKAALATREPSGSRSDQRRALSPRQDQTAVNAKARRYYESGPSLLYRYLPFQTAAWIDRVKLVLLPMCTLLLPMLRVVPSVFNWRVRSKLNRWYRELRDIERRLKDADAAADLSEDLARLQQLERELSGVSVPAFHMQEFYNLRMHASYVLERLTKMNSSRSQRAA